MGGSSSKKKDETKEKRVASSNGGEKDGDRGDKEKGGEKGEKVRYDELITREPADLGGKIHPENISPFITKLLRDDDITIKRVLVYCNYIISGISPNMN